MASLAFIVGLLLVIACLVTIYLRGGSTSAFIKVVFVASILLCGVSGYYALTPSDPMLRQPLPVIVSSSDEDYKAQDQQAYVKQRSLEVGTLGASYPWSYKGLGGASCGFSVELLTKAAALMGKEIHFVHFLQAQQMYQALENRQIDIIADLQPVTDNSTFSYSKQIIHTPFVLISLGEKLDKLRQQLYSSHTGGNTIKTSVSNQPIFRTLISSKLAKHLKVKVRQRSKDIFQDVIKGYTSLGFVGYFTYLAYNHDHPKSRLAIIEPMFFSPSSAFAFVLNAKQLMLQKQLNIALVLLKRRNVMSGLAIKYFHANVTL